jgi:hypothetical protein
MGKKNIWTDSLDVSGIKVLSNATQGIFFGIYICNDIK